MRGGASNEEPSSSQVDVYGTLPESIDYLIEHPIHCGFLLAFCESQYSAENLRYLMEIDRFRDHFATDTTSWGPLTWRQIDRNMGITAGEVVSNSTRNALSLGDEKDWPSTIVPRHAVVAHIESIWDNYLSDNAANQICVPSKVLHNTKRRLELLHIYGKEVFGETTIDPLKTMNRDVLPRFLQSEYFSSMESHVAQCHMLPQASTLSLPLPSRSMVLESALIESSSLEMLRADIPTIIHDRILYVDFLDYLRSIVSSENLLCVRAISIYQAQWNSQGVSQSNVLERNEGNAKGKDPEYNSGHSNASSNHFRSQLPHQLNRFGSKTPPGAEEMAWKIYLYFVAQGSAYEVSVSHRRRKEIMQGLAKPTIDLFDRVEKGCIMALKTHYDNYLKTPAFAKLPETIRNERNSKAKAMKTSRSCFGL